MRNKILFFALMWAALAMSVSGQTVSLVDSSVTPSTVTYDSYSGSDTTGPQFTFTVKLSSKPSNTVYFSAVINGSSSPSSRALTSSSNTLTVGFYQDSSYNTEIKSTSDYPPYYYISGSFARKTNILTQTFTVYPLLAKGQSVPWGTYTGTFSIRLYQSSTPTGTLRDSETIYYTANVDQTIDVRVGSSGGSYDTGESSYNIALGDLSQGPTGSFGIFVRGNTAYTLYMNVTSGGYLTSTTTSDKVSYSLTINGISYTLGPSVIIDRQTSKAMYSKVLLGEISVPSGQDVEAGQYSDIVSFSVVAN
jgi:hypothetical protein